MNLKTKSLIAVIIGNSIFGFSFLFSKVALQMTAPSVLLAVRFTAAFAVLNLIAFVGRNIKKKDGSPLVEFSLKGKPFKYVLLLALFQPIVYFLGESYGIEYTSSAFAGTIIAVIPIMGIVFDVLIMKAGVTVKQILCAVVSVIGVVVTTLGAEGMKSSLIGVLFLLIAVVAGALFYVFSKKSGEHFNALEQTYVMFAAGSIAYITVALVQCAGNYKALILTPVASGNFWICILYLAVMSSVVAFVALNYGSSNVSVTEASLFANLTTVISIVAGVVIMGENFSLQQIIGAVLIIGSVYIANVEVGKKEESKG